MTNEAKIVTVVGVLIAILLAGVGYYATRSDSNSGTASTRDVSAKTDLSDAGQVTRSDSYTRGDSDAKVHVVEFGDFQCPACGSVEPELEQLMATYSGKGVDLTFRNFPLSQHKNAQLAATAAEAAGEQGKYWEMHDQLYTTQDTWTADAPASQTYDQAKQLMVGYAQQLGLNVDTFTQAVDARKFNDKISRDMADGDALGVNATPTFFVNGVKADSFNTLSQMIDAALAQ